MRIQFFLAVSAVALGGLATGCGDDSSTASDMTATADMVKPPDMVMLPDLMPTFSGTAVLTEVAGTIPLGGMMVPVKTLTPVVDFTSSANAKPSDFSNQMSGLGCAANHYSMANNDLPAVGQNAGPVKFTGYKGGTLLTTMMAAPSEINCAFTSNMRYECGYGPLSSGMPSMLSTGSNVFAGSTDTLPAGTPITASGMGMDTFGTFNFTDVAVAGGITSTNPLSGITFNPMMDLSVPFTCPNESPCGASVAVFQVTASSNTPDMIDKPAPTWGELSCRTFATGGKVDVPKAAIAAMLGCDNTGANCDANIKSHRITLVRLAVPNPLTGKPDSKGNPVISVGGHGQFAITGP